MSNLNEQMLSKEEDDNKRLQPIQYVVTETGLKFHNSQKGTRMVCGPFGSGKSVMCIEELLFQAFKQTPATDNVRYTRFGIIRSTYPALKTTTRRTVIAAMPQNCGKISSTSPMEGVYKIPLSDGTMAHMELIFLAIDGSDESINKLKSTDFTGIWINEITDVTSDVYTQCLGRIGRYPGSDKAPQGITHPFLIADYNKPPETHWISDLEKNPPPDCEFFYQPPAAFKIEEPGRKIRYRLNPNAENLRVLGDNYYRKQIEARIKAGDYDGVDILFCLKSGGDNRGKPVWGKSFDRKFHVAAEIINPDPNLPVLFGCDTSGIHPCIILFQKMEDKYVALDEVFGDGVGFSVFLSSGLIPLLKQRYPHVPSISGGCDPANARDAWQGLTPTERLIEIGLQAVVAPTNATKPRIEAVNELLNKRTGGILISPNCKFLIGALEGGYKYSPTGVRGGGAKVFSDTPLKNEFSHYADALQYFALFVTGNSFENSLKKSEVLQMVKGKFNRAGSRII